MLRQRVLPFSGSKHASRGCTRVCGQRACLLNGHQSPRHNCRLLSRCQALGNQPGQPSSLTAKGDGAPIMPFDINNPGEEANMERLSSVAANNTNTSLSSKTEAQTDSPSWESWLKVFEEMDKSFEQQEHLKILIQDAVRCEDYSKAAALKRELAAVQDSDVVATVRRDLAAALEKEQYQEAAKLRDLGMAWVQGWWAGISENDPVGHLMHVTPEFGRYTGRVYTTRDLADLAGIGKDLGNGPSLAALRAALAADSSSSDGVDASVGSPAMEVFVVKDAQGRFMQQTVSLLGQKASSTPGGAKAGKSQTGGTSVAEDGAASSLAAAMGLGPMAKVTVTISTDGSATIKAIPIPKDEKPSTGAVKSKLTSWEMEEAVETLKALADVPKTEPTTTEETQRSPSSISKDSEADEIAAALAALADPSETSETSSRVQGGAVQTVEPDLVLQAPAVPEEELRFSNSAEMTAAANQGLAEITEGVTDEVQGSGRSYSLSVDEGDIVVDISAANAVDLDATVAEESDSDGDDDRGLVTELHRSPAELSMVSFDEFVLQLPQHPNTTSNSTVQGANSSEDQSLAAKFDFFVPLGQLTADSSVATAALTVVAQKITKIQSERSGHELDAMALCDALQQLIPALSEGKTDVVYVPAAASEDESRIFSTTPSQQASVPSTRYTRLPTVSTSDPFDGLYIGSFGPHGPELLSLKRVVIDGEEMVQATKVTGDANVPAGTISFRAKIGRKHKQSAAGVYPEELGVQSRYSGQGRVAGKGYQKPRWVDGDLLVFSSSSTLTAGAQLGFVWHVPGERKFLILLNKVNLAACAERTSTA